jgi:phosphate acetyltransferase
MSFIEEIKNKAKSDLKKIVLAEGTEPRNIKAASIALKEGIANIVLLGDPEEVKKVANGLDLSKAEIIDPKNAANHEEFAQTFYELRKNKGMTIEKARELMSDTVQYGVMMVKKGIADGIVSGAIHSTADILRPALQILKTAPGTKLVSSYFVMEVPNGQRFLFADCGLNINPTADELSEIAISTGKTYKSLFGEEPKIAMLSYSTKGSGKGEMVDKVVEATRLAQEKAPELLIDGELQLDAALVPEVANLKAKGSAVAGQANVLVFPDINAGNIGYKLVQRLANAEAYGPITQGIAAPANDLSRGCSAEDIVGVIAITAVQSAQI